MGNNIYKNLIGVFALLMVGFALSGCIGQPAAQAPTPPPAQVVKCGTDLYLCPSGAHVARDYASNCQFMPCPAPIACTQEAKLCSDGSYVSRNSSKSCAFDACPLVIPAPNVSNLAAEGATCAGVAGIKCQYGLQCIISGQPGAEGTCTTPAPPLQAMKQCPEERYKTCTNELSPVCGKGTDSKATFRDYNNACEACSTSSNAIGYYTGTCENQ